jgi:hypothetical protein
MNLWNSSDSSAWNNALDAYNAVIRAQDVNRLVELDRWYHTELPQAIKSRPEPHVTDTELAQLTEWKMKRGEWRARNLVLVKSNTPDQVIEVSTAGLAAIPHPTKPISTIATLAGVGPATASAVVAAFAPEQYPFFDELVAAQVPQLGDVKWTLGYYAKYATALRDKATELGRPFTPATVERALWANSGGKTGRG